MSRKSLMLATLALAELLVMSLWFSASAVVPQLTTAWGLDGAGQAWLTMSVQVGFVVGALASAAWNVADRVPARWLVAASALVGALANAVMAAWAEGLAVALPLRFLTGVALAGVYPPGMKLVVTWCKKDRGFGIGLLVGAITVGSAMPHLLAAWPVAGEAGGLPPWRSVLAAASGLALVGAILVGAFVRPGPYHTPARAFHWKHAARALAHRPTRLANIGYLGHMWELYAMWAWVPILLLAAYEQAGWSESAARVAGFGAIAAGGLGAVLAGLGADRIGRTWTTSASLCVSGACCLGAGLLMGHAGWLTALCLVWGFAVVADSAQFSAAVSELGDPAYVGTALTVQTCLGYLLTLVTLRAVPFLVDTLGWGGALPWLALGPAVGVWAMLRLRVLPDAVRMANGKR